MKASLISNERDRDQNEHYNQDDALLAFGEIENPE